MVLLEKLKENDIRKLLIEKLKVEYPYSTDTKIVNEMGILHGRSRIDVAVIEGILHGFEIKSECDTLERLPLQMNNYNKVFDRMTIVTQRKYIDKVRKIVPKWWAIWLVTKYKGKFNIREIRKGRLNKEIDLQSLSHLLWKDEAIELLKQKGLHKGYLSKPRQILYSRLAENIEKSELQLMINEKLKLREGWRVDL